MAARKHQVLSLSWASCGLLLAALVLLNVAVARSNVRLDLTEEGLYTLSDGTRKILGELKDPVSIKVFWDEFPPQYHAAERYVEALLDEMADVSNDHVQVTWLDMTEDSSAAEAEKLGAKEYIYVAPHGDDEVRQTKGYMSIVIEMGDGPPEAINAVAQVQERLEYLLMATIHRRSLAAPPVIGMVSNRPFNPFGGQRQAGPFTFFEQMLQQTFGRSARTYLDLESPIADDVDVLILARPRDLTEKQVYHFEQFLLRGGRGILLEDPADLENVGPQSGPQPEPHDSGLAAWLAHLGITVERAATGDFANHGKWIIQLTPDQAALADYPYVPIIERETMATDHPIMRDIPAFTLYWPAPLSVDTAKQELAGRTVTTLATTSDAGYRRPSLTGLKGRVDGSEGKLLERVPLALLVEGPTKSFWLGKPVPGSEPPPADETETPATPADAAAGDEAVPAEDGEAPAKDDAVGTPDGPVGSPDGPSPDAPKPEAPKPDAPKPDAPKSDAPKEDAPKKDAPAKDAPAKGEDGDESADAAEEEGPARLERGEIHLMILGDADFLDGRILRTPWVQRYNGAVGPGLILNAADWLSGSEELLALRSRAANPRTLEKLEAADQEMIKHVNFWAVPLLVILAGLTMFFVRRSS